MYYVQWNLEESTPLQNRNHQKNWRDGNEAGKETKKVKKRQRPKADWRRWATDLRGGKKITRRKSEERTDWDQHFRLS